MRPVFYRREPSDGPLNALRRNASEDEDDGAKDKEWCPCTTWTLSSSHAEFSFSGLFYFSFVFFFFVPFHFFILFFVRDHTAEMSPEPVHKADSTGRRCYGTRPIEGRPGEELHIQVMLRQSSKLYNYNHPNAVNSLQRRTLFPDFG